MQVDDKRQWEHKTKAVSYRRNSICICSSLRSSNFSSWRCSDRLFFNRFSTSLFFALKS